MIKIRMQVPLLLLLTCPLLMHAQDDSTKAATKLTSPQNLTYNLLFEVQSRKITTAAVGQISGNELQKTTSASFGGLLTGRLAGLYTSQTSGEPGNDDVSLLVRGQTPLVMVDGTPQSFNSINPEQIETITVLKDAVATAMMGMRASGGLILITTKKGSYSGQKIEFMATGGIEQPTQLPKFLHAYDYARLYNEALANDGKAPIYSQADLNAYQNHTDSLGHPDVDWESQVLRKQMPFSRYDLAVSGGSKTVRYFANLDYLGQTGIFQSSDVNNYITNSDYKRYIFRSNVEMDLNKDVTVSLNLFGRIQNSIMPGASSGTIFSNLLSTPNNAYPVRNSDSSFGGNQNYQTNIYAQTVQSGYQQLNERDFKADIAMKIKLDMITKGLWVRGSGSINSYINEVILRTKTFPVFQQSIDTSGKNQYKQFGALSAQTNTGGINSQNRLAYTEVSMGYERSFGKHNLKALALYSNDNRMINTNLPLNYEGVSGKVTYDYNEKYVVELVGAYNGSEHYPVSNRNGFFPAVGLGWNVGKEAFLKSTNSWLDNLKIRASYGRTGNDAAGYYLYNQYYFNGNAYGFGSTVPSSTTTLMQGALANPNITWEKANKLNIGLDASMFKNQLSFSLDYFNNKMFDLLQYPTNMSSIFGTSYVGQVQNVGSNRYSGVELQATWQKTSGAFNYYISPNISVQKTKVLYVPEPAQTNAYSLRTGQAVGQTFGYQALGLFQSKAEIAASPYQGGGIVPGDIKYKDLNGDGIIDANDLSPIGTTKPFIYYGLSLGANYKGFDISVLLQGAANRNEYVGGTNYISYLNNGQSQAFAQALNRWTPENAANATQPRLSIGTNVNNSLISSYWAKSGNYMRFKVIEIGYSLKINGLKKIGLSGSRFFLNATNLFTLTSLKDYDPEGVIGRYPVAKAMSAGIKIKL